MIRVTRKELHYRLCIIAIASIIILIIEVQYLNELIVLLFDPIKELQNDWYNELIHYLINGTFEMFDREWQPEYITEYTVEYIPSYEITIQSTIVHNTTTILAINLSVSTITIIIWYNVVLYAIPSLFTFEKQIFIYTIIQHICIFLITILLTHYVWAHFFWNLSFHQYSEFNYYEFDVEFDMHSYICKYLYTIYITFILIWLITIRNRVTYQTSIIIFIALLALQIIYILEIGYYTLIIITFTEIKKFIYITNKKRNNLYILEL